jgi:hypothetical protein
MMHPGDGRLQALLDGELTAAGRREVEAHLRACPACADEAAQLRARSERVSALLELADTAPPILAAQAAFHRRRRGGAAAGAVRRSLPRAAVLVLALAGAAAAAVVPGSPLRERLLGGPPAERALEEAAVERTSPAATERPGDRVAPTAVSIAPVDGRVRVVVTGSSPELRVRARLADVPRAEVTAWGAAAGARFRTSPGRIEVLDAGPGEIVVHLPAAARAAYLEVNGRVYAAKEGSALRALAPTIGGSTEEPVFRAGGGH